MKTPREPVLATKFSSLSVPFFIGFNGRQTDVRERSRLGRWPEQRLSSRGVEKARLSLTCA